MKSLLAHFVLCLFLSLSALAQHTQVESRIHQAYQTAWQGNASPLEQLTTQFKNKTSSDATDIYWEAYANYRLAIYYAGQGKKDEAEELTDYAIELLDDLKKKDSEAYALLSCITGFSIQFSPMSAAFLGPKSGKYAKKSVSLNQNNKRGHFAIANNDFYTPAMFGGGELVEKHLKTALSLAPTTGDSPSWSTDEAYELLIRFYIKEERTDDAKFYCKQALAKYPNDMRLKAHAKSLGLAQ